MFQVALNGLTNNSATADHVWCVFSMRGEYIFDLTRQQAEEIAAHLNRR